jgi:hypothetical protein
MSLIPSTIMFMLIDVRYILNESKYSQRLTLGSASVTFLSLSRVACRLANSEDEEALVGF